MRAASRGHLPIVQWCRANGCPWNTWTCAGAAQSGRLDILQWCRDNGCPWDTWTRWYAHQPHLRKWCTAILIAKPCDWQTEIYSST
jgi:hypothetical protein